MFNSYQTIPTLVVFALPSTMPHTIMSLPCRTQCSDIIISKKFHHFDRISQFWQNLTILTDSHNFDRISQFWQNFTILRRFHNFGQICQNWQNVIAALSPLIPTFSTDSLLWTCRPCVPDLPSWPTFMTYLPDLLPFFKRHFLQLRHYIGQFRNSCDVLGCCSVIWDPRNTL